MERNTPTAWVGWVYFASVMMVLLGGLQAIIGLVAIFKDEYFIVTRGGVLAFDFTTWGWIHLVLGLLILAAGIAVMAGSAWGRFVGVFLAVLSALANLTFLGSYPLWSIIVIIIDILIIYALHGTEVRSYGKSV